MNQYNEIFKKKTVNIPLTHKEEEALSFMSQKTGVKFQFYVRSLVVDDLEKKGWLSAVLGENNAQGANKTNEK